MKTNLLRWSGLVILILPLILGAYPLAGYAKKGGGSPGGFEKGEKKGWGESEVPPGYSHGEKKGWEGKDTPPGLTPGEEE